LNNTESAGVYVKVTTDYDKISESIDEDAGVRVVQLLLLIPFIIVMAILVIVILFYRKKIKAEDKERISKKPEDVDESKSKVVEGEIVSERAPGAPSDKILPAETPPHLPPGPRPEPHAEAKPKPAPETGPKPAPETEPKPAPEPMADNEQPPKPPKVAPPPVPEAPADKEGGRT